MWFWCRGSGSPVWRSQGWNWRPPRLSTDTRPLSDWAGNYLHSWRYRGLQTKRLKTAGFLQFSHDAGRKSTQHLSACWLFPGAVVTWPLLIRITKHWADSDSGGLRWLWSKSARWKCRRRFLMYSNPQNLCLWWKAAECASGGVGWGVRSGVAARETVPYFLSCTHAHKHTQAAEVCTSQLPVVM